MCKTYKVGVYGTRNVCQRLADEGLTVSSYVSNMSSGFSGNLGFKMPSNWNFDQFNETTVSDFDIDKVGYSGKHGFVTTYGLNFDITESESQVINESVYNLIEKIVLLEDLANEFIVSENEMITGLWWEYKKSPYMILNYLRETKYAEGMFYTTLAMNTSKRTGFYDFVYTEKNT